jgi:hypothetical protein
MSTDVVNVDEYEALAQRRMSKAAFDFFARGSEDQVSLRENRAAFTRIRYAHSPRHQIPSEHFVRAQVSSVRAQAATSGSGGCEQHRLDVVNIRVRHRHAHHGGSHCAAQDGTS